MSLSPTSESTSDQVRQYDVGWTATNKLIRKGKSFSGAERHCAFLNIGDGSRFATISGAAGLDFIDDGRGLALCDWDYDGRTDFWLTNRTGPRLRFVHNRYQSGNTFVAFKLEGAASNRDAIGARVTVKFNRGKPVSRSVFAGSGYLSQSTRWQNIGVADETKITSVTVRWPGGQSEQFSGVASGGFYHLKEDTGTAVAWDPPKYERELFDAEPVPAPAETGVARVLPIVRPPLPDSLSYVTPDGQNADLKDLKGKPLLIQIWASWCPNCKAQMVQWKAAKAEIEKTGVRILSLSVDERSGDLQADLAKMATVTAERGYPWASGLADTRLLDHLNVIQKAYVGRQQELPLPSTFLIDASGALVAIYKGAIAPDVLMKDIASAKGGESRDEIVARALPYPGQWLEPPPGTMPRGIAIGLVEHGFEADAKLYLEQLLPIYATASDSEGEDQRERYKRELGECHNFLGAISYDASEKSKAIDHYLRGLLALPNDRRMRSELARCYLDLGQLTQATEQVQWLVDDRPDDYETVAQLAGLRAKLGESDRAVELFDRSLALRDLPETRNAFANLLRDLGRAPQAADHYRAALAARPEWPLPANNLAWILAAHPDDTVRDGADALRFATIAADTTGHQIPPILSTLAAAQAEVGDFQAAATTLAKAIAIATARGDDALVGRLEQRASLISRNQPIRDPDLLPDTK